MRLNSLTLSGFKSFPVRTQISFTKGIVIIVGPNGCGKSNIIDALRWVLGEQSPSMLRARSMDDCLYSGDGDRQIDMAEVRLVIDTQGTRPFPELGDTPEIEIIRRIHRSGNTEYRINGKACRLKDIRYIFMDTGAGTRAYSIWDQAQISAFVDMGPEERRHLIEEVAGISKYKARRAEAEQRMSQTRQNLERLGDVLAELERHRRSLSRQAKRTEHYLELRREQDQLDQALLSHMWSTEMDRRTALEREKEGLSVALSGIQAGLSKEVSNKEGLGLKVLEAEEELAGIRRGLTGAEECLQGLREEAAGQEKLLIKDEDRLRSSEKALSEIEERQVQTGLGDKGIREKIDSLKKEETLCLANVSSGIKGVEESERITDQLKESLEAVKVQFVDAMARYTRLDSRRNSLRDRGDRLGQRLDRGEDDLQAISGEIKGLEDELAGLGIRAEECQARLDHLSQDEARYDAIASAQRGRLSEITQKRHEINSGLMDCSARLKALKAIEASGEGLSKGTNTLLGSDIPTLGVLADFLEVEPGWEHVIEIALGYGVQAVVMPDMETCDRAVALLKDRAGGRVSLIIPRTDYRPGKKREGTLLEVVKARSPVGIVAADILTRWKVVSDLRAALEARSGQDQDLFYITRDGEVLTPWGELAFGGQGKASSGILARKAEISRLSIRKNELDRSYSQVCSEEEEIKKVLLEAEIRLKGLNKEKRQVLEALAGHNRERDRLLLKIESKKERSQRIGFELEQAREEVCGLETSLKELDGLIQVANAARTEAEGHIKGREDALRQQAQVLSRRREALEGHRIELARIQTQLQEREQELQRLADRRARLIQERDALLEERQGLEGRLGERTRSLRDVRLKIEAQEKVISNTKRRLEDAEEEYDRIRQAVAAVDVRIRDLEGQVRDLEGQVHKNELALSEVEQALLYLKKTAQERHQKDIEKWCDRWRLSPFSPDAARERIKEIAHAIDQLGPVNLGAVEEYRELEERRNLLNSQKEDLLNSIKDLEQAIKRINHICRTRFKEALDSVNKSLSDVFPMLFEGGSAELSLTQGGDMLDAGLDYLIRLPGKRIQHLNLLSGGEKTMAAMALVFAIYFIKPSPFCLLDEVDAALDGANIVRFKRLIKKISEQSQVVLITHNQKIMEAADTLYGVTMEDKGISKLVSVELVENPAP